MGGGVAGLEWLGVVGVEIRWNGTEGPQRSVLVRTDVTPLLNARGAGE